MPLALKHKLKPLLASAAPIANVPEGHKGEESESSSQSRSTAGQGVEMSHWGSGEPRNHIFHRGSFPPESSATMLTPSNDPESTFSQRPVPPHVLDHSIPEVFLQSQGPSPTFRILVQAQMGMCMCSKCSRVEVFSLGRIIRFRAVRRQKFDPTAC